MFVFWLGIMWLVVYVFFINVVFIIKDCILELWVNINFLLFLVDYFRYFVILMENWLIYFLCYMFDGESIIECVNIMVFW